MSTAAAQSITTDDYELKYLMSEETAEDLCRARISRIHV